MESKRTVKGNISIHLFAKNKKTTTICKKFFEINSDFNFFISEDTDIFKTSLINNRQDIILIELSEDLINVSEELNFVREKVGYSTPLFAILNKKLIELRDEIFRIGFDDYILLPLSLQELKNKFNKFFSGNTLLDSGSDNKIKCYKNLTSEVTDSWMVKLFDELPFGLIVVGMDEKIICLNSTSQRMVGLSQSKDTLDLEESDIFENYVSEIKSTDYNIYHEIKFLITRNKEKVPVIFNKNKINYRGTEAYLICFIDIGFWVENIEKSDHELNLFRNLLDNLPDLISIKDNELRYVYNNRSHLNSIGAKNQSDTLYKSSRDFYSESVVSNFVGNDMTVLQSGQPLYELEEQVFNKSFNENRWHLTSKIPLIDSTGKLNYIFSISHDITNRKIILEDKIYNQSLLNSTLESILEGILVVDLNGSIVKTNKKFLEMWRIPEDVIQSKDDDLLLMCIIKQLKAPESYLIKIRELYANPDRESFDILEFLDGRIFERFSLPQILNDKTIGRVWSFRDVTIRKQMENKLRLFAYTINSISDCVSITDINDNIMFVNPAFLRTYGYEESELIGKHISIVRSKKNSLRNHSNILSHTLIGQWEGEIWNEKKDGTVFLIHLSSSTITDPHGKTIALLGIASDITEKKKFENIKEALYEISEAVNTITDMYPLYKKIHSVIATLMPVKNIYFALLNKEGTKIGFPYLIDEKDPEDVSSVFFDINDPYSLTAEVIRAQNPIFYNEKTLSEKYADGKDAVYGTTPKCWLGVPLRIGDKIIGVVAVQDYDDENAYNETELQILTFVSEQAAQAIQRKQSMDEIQKYTEELKESNSTKDKLFSIIAHDLRSPFNVLLGFSNILATEAQDLGIEQIKSLSNTLNQSLKKQFELLDDLLNWARLQTKNFSLNIENFDLFNLTQSVIEALSITASQKEIKLYNNISTGAFVMADANMIKLVLRNLISNAIKFTYKNGSISVSCIEKKDFLEITVSDTGVGIDQKDLSKLFRIDINHTTKGTAKESGTGFGLILCKEVITKHNGTIIVQSEPGKGSNFIFSLPKSTAAH